MVPSLCKPSGRNIKDQKKMNFELKKFIWALDYMYDVLAERNTK
jgi:hypothetical protein